MAEPLTNRLLAHEFVVEAMFAAHHIRAELPEQNYQALLKLKSNPLYSYVQNVFVHLRGLLSMVDRLDHAALFITSFSPSKRMREAGITRKSQLQYGIESYIIRTASLYDRSLISVNAVCGLNIKPRAINDSSVRKHYSRLGPEITSSLDQLNVTLEQFRQDRHAIVHRENYNDQELGLLDDLEIAVYLKRRNPEVVLGEHTDFGVAILPALTRDFARKKYREFALANVEICSKVAALLDALHPSYKARIASLQEVGL